MLVSVLVEACFEEFFREHARLGKAVNAAPDIKVDPAVAGVFEEVVFLCEFVGDVAEFDSDVLGAVERGVEIEVADVKGGKIGAGTLEEAVKDKFGEFKGSSWGAEISGKANAVAVNGDARAVGIVFFGADFANHFGVNDFFAAVGGDILEADEEEGVGAFGAFAPAVGRGADALEDPDKLVGVLLVPGFVEG